MKKNKKSDQADLRGKARGAIKKFLFLRSGEFKNTKLNAPDPIYTRPSKAILRDSVFDYLQDEVQETVFCEAFGGSGQVGLLALSRGAKKAIFIEKEARVFKTLEQNIAILSGKFNLDGRIRAFCEDTISYLPKLLDGMECNGAELILFLDPPFPKDDDDKIYEKCIKMLQNCDLKCCKYIIFEAKTSAEFPLKVQKFSIIRKRAFGKSSLIFYKG
ncbi:MAG: RsmD family RNA methyltransferase [Helicobacter sp.]|nr:RsmD family RNA methyltransferase [Helicobacter sp.]